MKKKLFSIIVPVYNTEKYIYNCLKSILVAISDDCEVIIINDGSTDDSEKKIEKFLDSLDDSKKKLFKYIYKKNKGLAHTKNTGIEMACGEYISVIDSDDWINKNFYNDARDFIKDGYDVIIYNLYVVYEKNRKPSYIANAIDKGKKDFLEQIFHGAMLGSSCNKIIKKDLYTLKFPVGKEYEDVAVTPFILLSAKKIKYIANPNYYYLQREKSIVSNNRLEEAFIKINSNINSVLLKSGEYKQEYSLLINAMFIENLIYNLDLAVIHNHYKSKEYINKLIEKCQLVIKYTYENKIFLGQRSRMTGNRYVVLCKIVEGLYSKNIRKVIIAIKFRLFINWLRKVAKTFWDFIRAIFGGMYYE